MAGGNPAAVTAIVVVFLATIVLYLGVALVSVAPDIERHCSVTFPALGTTIDPSIKSINDCPRRAGAYTTSGIVFLVIGGLGYVGAGIASAVIWWMNNKTNSVV